MDLFVVAALVGELEAWRGAWFRKAWHPEPRCVLLHLAHRALGSCYLVLRFDIGAEGLGALRQKQAAPATPTAFAMALRKALRGRRLGAVEQLEGDRIIAFDLVAGRAGEEVVTGRLIAEFMGRHGNLMVVDGADRLLAVLRPLRPPQSRRRALYPGAIYRPPPPLAGRRRLWDVAPGDLEALADHEGKLDATALAAGINGLSPGLARALVETTGGSAPAVMEALAGWRAASAAGDVALRTYRLPSGRLVRTGVPLQGAVLVEERRRDILFALGEDLDPAPAAEGPPVAVVKVIRGALRRAEKRYRRIERDRDRLQSYLEGRRLGELLKPALHRLKRGQTSVEVVDYADPEQRRVRIELDPTLSPKANMERWFQRARKGARGLEIAERRLEATRADIERLKELLYRAEQATSPESREALRAAAEEAGLLVPAAGREAAAERSIAQRPTAWDALPIRSFRSSSGLLILCGKNQRGNELILRRFGRPDDYWLHVRDVGGAHVLLRLPSAKAAPTDQDFEEAARVAAFFSRARGEASALVTLCRFRHVRRIPRGPAGAVRFSRDRTLRVSARGDDLPPALDEASS